MLSTVTLKVIQAYFVCQLSDFDVHFTYMYLLLCPWQTMYRLAADSAKDQ